MKLKLRSEVKVGIFALLMLIFLYWGINFLKGQDFFNRNSTYYAAYEEVNGLQKSGSVMVKGFKIGLISDIIYDPQKSDKIIVEMSLRSRYKIPENSTAKIFSDGLLGGKAIELEFGPSQIYLQSGDTIRSETDHGMLGFSGSDIEFVKQKASQLMNNLNVTLSNINSLVGDNTESINQIFSNIAGMTGTLNSVLSSEQGSLRGIISDINDLSATLKSNTGRIDNILENVEGFTDSLRRADISGLIDNLSVTLSEFNTLLSDVNSGEGSVGKLLGDDGLYDSLVESASNLARLLEDVKQNPERYINISVFGGKKSK